MISAHRARANHSLRAADPASFGGHRVIRSTASAPIKIENLFYD
jgi:hypothetical protein